MKNTVQKAYKAFAIQMLYMVNKLVNVRMDKKMVDAIDRIVDTGFYTSRGDFIKSTIREKIEEQLYLIDLRKRVRKLAKKAVERGADFRELTKEEKDEIAKEMLKEYGLEKFIG